MPKNEPSFPCPYCVGEYVPGIPSYALSSVETPPSERPFLIVASEYEHHCFVSHIRLSNPTAEERRVRMARHEYSFRVIEAL